MNWIDIVILVCVSIGVINGLLKGLIHQVAYLLSLAGGILFAGWLANPIKSLFLLLPENSIRIEIINVLSYSLAFIIIMLAIVLIGKIVTFAINLTPAKLLNKIAGAVLGGIIWILGLSLLINVVQTFDINSMLIKQDQKKESSLYEPVRKIVPTVYPIIQEYFKK